MGTVTEHPKPTIVGMIVSPVETMRRIREQPIFLRAALVLCVTSLILFGIIGYYQVNDPKFLEVMVKQMPQEIKALPEVQQQMAIAYVKRVNLSTVIAMGGIAAFLLPLLGAILLKFIFILLRHREATFKQLYSFFVHLYTIFILAIFVQAIAVMVTGGNLSTTPTSLAGILPVSEGLGKAILMGFDVFIIWSLVLLKVGLVEITRLTARKAWVITIFFFFIIIGLHISGFMYSN